MILKDAGLVSASGYAAVGGFTQTIDLGSAASNFSGVAVIDVDAIEIASNDELYTLMIVGSNTADFSGAKQVLASLPLGATEVRPVGAVDSFIGRYEMPFVNSQAGQIYRYLRVYTLVAGSIASGIDFRAYVGRSSIAAM